MPFHQSGCLRYYTFDSLDDAKVPHAVFTRQGGVSPNPWASLNLGGTVGDEPLRVAQNRHRAFQAVGRDLGTLFDVWQVHSTNVVLAKTPRNMNLPYLQADAMLTDRMNITLLMRFADCVPILLYDPLKNIIGIVHSGWPGTVKRIPQAAVEAMQKTFHSCPQDILAAIGPSICLRHYEIGLDVEAQVRNAFGDHAEELLHSSNGSIHFNLWAANRLILEECGVCQIELAGLCTACHPEDWYSHRGENGQTGRFGVLIGLT